MWVVSCSREGGLYILALFCVCFLFCCSFLWQVFLPEAPRTWITFFTASFLDRPWVAYSLMISPTVWSIGLWPVLTSFSTARSGAQPFMWKLPSFHRGTKLQFHMRGSATASRTTRKWPINTFSYWLIFSYSFFLSGVTSRRESCFHKR